MDHTPPVVDGAITRLFAEIYDADTYEVAIFEFSLESS
jgi:hypothetical protein